MSKLLFALGLVSVGVAAMSTSPAHAGSGGESPLYTIDNDADREIARRQQELALAEDALRRGDAALKAGNVEQAYLAYKQAVDFTPDGPTTRSLRARALSRYSSTAVRYAEFLVSEGQYAQAEAVATRDVHGRQDRVGEARVTREEQERSATDRLVAHDVDLDAEDPASGGEDRGGPCALQCVEPAQAALAVADRTEPEDETREQARALASEIHQGEEHEAYRR